MTLFIVFLVLQKNLNFNLVPTFKTLVLIFIFIKYLNFDYRKGVQTIYIY